MLTCIENLLFWVSDPKLWYMLLEIIHQAELERVETHEHMNLFVTHVIYVSTHILNNQGYLVLKFNRYYTVFMIAVSLT